MILSELKENESGIITDINGDEKFIKRLSVLGVKKGDKVKVIRFSLFNDPMEIEIKGFNLAIRKENANKIKVIKS